MKWEDHPELAAGIGEERIRTTGSFVIQHATASDSLRSWKARTKMDKALHWIPMVMLYGTRASEVFAAMNCILMVMIWVRIKQLGGECTMMRIMMIISRKRRSIFNNREHDTRRRLGISRNRYCRLHWTG